MVLSILIIVIVAAVTYFHWVQGLFSGVISMALALMATSIAMGMHESLNASLLGGKFADSANAMMLCLLFAGVYGIGRVVFDSFIPGNVNLPLYVDRVGGGLCGVVVGIFTAGTFAVAAQSLPLGPQVGYFSRYPLAEPKIVAVPGKRSNEDATVTDALEEDFPAPDKEVPMIFAADAMAVSFAGFQSDGGALASGLPLRQQHPDLLRELFFARTGIETGAKHTALNIGGKKEVEVVGVYAPASLAQTDGELTEIRNRKLPPRLESNPNQVVLVLRVTVKSSATDADRNFRFSPGTIRLVSNGAVHYPLGTLHGPGQLLLANRIDDYLVAKADEQATIDLVFLAPRADVLADPAAKDGLKIKPGAFVEVKRYARVDLSDKDVAARQPPVLPTDSMLRKKSLIDLLQKRAGGDAGA